MATTHLPVIGGHPTGPATTMRSDNWWAGPVAVFLYISVLMTYLTWAALQGQYYFADPYLTPVYSPVLFGTTTPGSIPLEHAWFGAWPSWWPSFLPASPALFALAGPGLLRFTCYYYRKAYYRSFVGSPPGCAVTPIPRRGYKGETGLLIFQNLHRYAMYISLFYLPILTYDALIAFHRDGEFGIGVGTIIICINTCLLASYSFGCHSFRHVFGGHDDCMSCGQNTAKLSVWRFSTWFNERHMQIAMVSLFWVAFTDFYIRMVSMGFIKDLNTWN
ncbi:MAG TPA: hypothetical protein VHN14_22900 [Kofleriaceae bacterium]|nr:hypothetical protein [Kofleriaceae bacterium]